MPEPCRNLVAEALGKNCTKEAGSILTNACGRKQDRSIRLTGVRGLEQLGRGPNKDITARAWVELQLLAEIDSDNEVQALAQKARQRSRKWLRRCPATTAVWSAIRANTLPPSIAA